MNLHFLSSSFSESFTYEVPTIHALYQKFRDEAVISADLNEIRVGETVAIRNKPKGWLESQFKNAHDNSYRITAPNGLNLNCDYKGRTAQETLDFIVNVMALNEAKRVVPDADVKAALKAALLNRAALL